MDDLLSDEKIGQAAMITLTAPRERRFVCEDVRVGGQEKDSLPVRPEESLSFV
jgi:hypothetical protein